MKKTAIGIMLIGLGAAVAAVWLFTSSGLREKDEIIPSAAEASPVKLKKAKKNGQNGGEVVAKADAAQDGDSGEEAAESPEMTPEEKKEAEEEALVEAFDAMTDKWMEPSPKGVSMDDIGRFADAFRKLPKSRRDECIHRALNLVPDENVMLLAGILMDKSFDHGTIETVFNDILNRDESVKKPMLQQIFKDKTHPCWADTAWILDVTGELPAKKSR